MYAWSLRNPDDDFVLHGQSAALRSKDTEYLSNSQRTLTTGSLSQNTLYYNPEKCASMRDSRYGRSSSHDGDFPNRSLGRGSAKNVSFSSRGNVDGLQDSLRDDLEAELRKLTDGVDMEKIKEENVLVGRAERDRSRQWYTRPVHLTYSSEYPALQSAGLDLRNVHKTDRDVGTLGTNLAARRIISQNFLDEQAKKAYPVTLGGGDGEQDILRTFSPHPSLKHSRSKSPTAKHRPKSANDPRLRASGDYRFLTVAEPCLMRSEVIASPYEYELAKLRMHSLRLQEEKLLEVKRQLELERIRGPIPKWYEFKGPQFHYEARKNNELLKKKDEWQSLFDYRNDLLRASREFSKSVSY